MRRIWHLRWALLGIAVVVVLVLFFVFHRHREQLPTDPQQRWMWEWTHRSFTPISTDMAENRKLVERFPIDFRTSLTKEQEEKLLDTVALMLTIYRTGNFDLYRKYLEDRGAKVEEKLFQWMATDPVYGVPKSRLSPQDQEIFKDWKVWPPQTPWDQLRATWVKQYYPPGTGVWSGLDLSDAKIKVFQRVLEFSNDQPSMQEEAREMLELSGNKQVGELWGYSNISFPQDESSPIPYALVYFVAKYQNDPHAGPFGLWFRWSSRVHNWIMGPIMALYSGQRADNVQLSF